MINEAALKRIREANINGKELADIFNNLATFLQSQGAEHTALTVSYVKDDEIELGDFVPVVVYAISRHMPADVKPID